MLEKYTLIKNDPTMEDRFKEMISTDPYRRSDFLLEQFHRACPDNVIEIEGREYVIDSIERTNPDTTHTTDLVLRLGTQEGSTLFAKADVSEDFLYYPATKEITHVYGSRSKREAAMHRLQKMLNLPYTASATLKQSDNIWFVSEEAPGLVIGDPKVDEVIQSNPQLYCYELGRMLAFSYLFGLSDGHNLNSHYDGEILTQRDLESPFSDLVPLRAPILGQRREGISAIRLFTSDYEELFDLEDRSPDSEWKKIIAQSLEDHLWPLMGSQDNRLRLDIGKGFTACYETAQENNGDVLGFVNNTLTSWSNDPYFFLEMTEIGPFRPTLWYLWKYKPIMSAKLRVDNPWRNFNSIWNQLSWDRVEDVRKIVEGEKE